MFTTKPILTESGQDLLIRSIGGETITFTRFKAGKGSLPSGTTAASRTDLVNTVLSFGITEIDDTNRGYLKISGCFNSTNIPSNFQWKELGLFAKGEDNIEKLYCYINDGSNAGMLKANDSDILSEHDISMVLEIGEAEHFSAVLVTGNLYAFRSAFEAHVNDKTNPHEVTKAQVGLGNVPNVATDDQTPTISTSSDALNPILPGDKLSTICTRARNAIWNLIWHLADTSNPHSVTKSQVGLGDVPNVPTDDQTPTFTAASTLANIASGEKLSVIMGKIMKAIGDLISHLSNTSNPHSVTLAQVGGAAASHTHSATDVTGGVLSVDRGGTGQSNLPDVASALRTAMMNKTFDFRGQTAIADLDAALTPGIYFVSEGDGSGVELPFTHLNNQAMEGYLFVSVTSIFNMPLIHQLIISDSVPASQGGVSIPFGLSVEILRRQGVATVVDGAISSVSDWSAWE